MQTLVFTDRKENAERSCIISVNKGAQMVEYMPGEHFIWNMKHTKRYGHLHIIYGTNRKRTDEKKVNLPTVFE